MRLNRLLGVGWAPVVVALLLGMTLWGCSSENGVMTPESSYTPPPVGSGAGLLAVEIESFGSLNDDLEGVFATADSDSSKGQGHKERTGLTDLFVTFDAIRVYPACEDSTDNGDDGGGDEDSTLAGVDVNLLDEEEDGDRDRERELDGECEYLEFLIDPPVTVNVADLEGALNDVLSTLVLPAGEYTHLSVRLADAWVVTEDGETVPAKLPGGDQNWLKVIVKFTVEDGQVTAIVIAFDLSRSVVETPPGSGNFKIKPVLHAHVGQGSRHEGEGGSGDGGGQGSGGEGGSGGGGGK